MAQFIGFYSKRINIDIFGKFCSESGPCRSIESKENHNFCPRPSTSCYHCPSLWRSIQYLGKGLERLAHVIYQESLVTGKSRSRSNYDWPGLISNHFKSILLPGVSMEHLLVILLLRMHLQWSPSWKRLVVHSVFEMDSMKADRLAITNQICYPITHFMSSKLSWKVTKLGIWLMDLPLNTIKAYIPAIDSFSFETQPLST